MQNSEDKSEDKSEDEIDVEVAVVADDHISIWWFENAPDFFTDQFENVMEWVAYIPESMKQFRYRVDLLDTDETATEIEQGDGGLLIGWF